MKVNYTGIHHDLPVKVQKKVDAKFAKLSKILDGRGEHNAHVVLKQQKRDYKAEITVHFYDHQLVGIGTDTDLFKAMAGALDKLDAQAVKTREKWREKRKNSPKDERRSAALEKTSSGAAVSDGARVFRVAPPTKRKPITLDEAMLEIGKNKNYLVYRDADSDGLSVLIRRSDGHFDLVET